MPLCTSNAKKEVDISSSLIHRKNDVRVIIGPKGQLSWQLLLLFYWNRTILLLRDMSINFFSEITDNFFNSLGIFSWKYEFVLISIWVSLLWLWIPIKIASRIKGLYEFEGKITAICDIFNVTILVTIKKNILVRFPGTNIQQYDICIYLGKIILWLVNWLTSCAWYSNRI